MRSRPTRTANLGSLSHDVPKCQDVNGYDRYEDKESLSGANKEKEDDKVAIVVLGSCMSVSESLLPTI